MRSLIMTRWAGVSKAPALALAPLFGGAVLVVHQDRHARCGGQLALNVEQLITMADVHCARQAHCPGALDVVGGHDDACHPSSSSSEASRASVIPPTGSWPPVIATVPLYRSL